MKHFTAENTGQSAELEQGADFEITLPENPSTGFRWELSGDGGARVALLADDFDPAAGVGGEGMHHWRFRAVHPGVAEIALSLRRSWAPGESGRSFTLRVSVPD